MKYDHTVIKDGVLYRAGVEVPEKQDEQPVVVDNATTEPPVDGQKPKRGRPSKK